MNCEHCGAGMVLIPNRDYFFCKYCGAFHFPAESSEGIRILEGDIDGVRCPVCNKELLRASMDGYPGWRCVNCRGILIAQKSFGDIVKYRRARASGPPERPQPLRQEELERRVRCPRCTKTMETHPYYGPGNVVIDSCRHCRIVWLDYGEFAQVINAPGRDRRG
jgi:Zn-finger nucleic acid-binding protein